MTMKSGSLNRINGGYVSMLYVKNYVAMVTLNSNQYWHRFDLYFLTV